MMASKSAASVEWKRAQKVQISVDLIAAAKTELKFLTIVDNTPALKDRHVLEIAVERYLSCWLPLATEHTDHLLQPPLDCAWVWHCHKLNPVQYAKDCQQLFGKLVDVGTPEPSITNGEKLDISIWTYAYPRVPYHFIKAGDCAARQQQQNFGALPNKITIAYDLISAIERQASFYYQVCRPWMYDDRYLRVALERYRGFLHLIQLAKKKEANGGPRPFLVPTYDIDLLWHSHQLSPTAYRADTVKCMRTVLDHDDSDSNREAGAKLQTSFVDTCEQWMATYGTVYEHAGSLYRGSEPEKKIPPAPNADPAAEVIMGDPVNQERLTSHRQTLQVNLVLLGAADVHPTPKTGRRSCYFITVSALRKCPGLKLTTAPVACSSGATEEVTWNEGFSLEAELLTKGLRLELMKYTERAPVDCQKTTFTKNFECFPVFNKKPKSIGEIYIQWERDLLKSNPGLSLTKWVSLAQKLKKFPNGPPRLHFSVSITPPTPAPHIFRMLPAPVTDDKGLQVAKFVPSNNVRQEGRWITRRVVDHTGQERFVFRTRWAKGVKKNKTDPTRVSGAEAVIQVHEGPLRQLTYKETRNYRHATLVVAPSLQVSRAQQLDVECGQEMVSRRWSLLDGTAILTVKKPVYHGRLECDLQAAPCFTGYPMRVLSGRFLEYEVAGGNDMHENKYVTLIRYTPDAPMGKATALINWQTASTEVKPEENVVFVLLIANAISVSLVDMNFRPSNEAPVRRPKQDYPAGHLGSIQLQRNGLSNQWKRHSTDNKRHDDREPNDSWTPYCQLWLNLTSQQILGAYLGGGAGCGGGACTAGSCGGGGCGGGGCGGGGCGGCGGGCGG